MSALTAEDPTPDAPKKGFRPSGLFMLVLLLGVIVAAEILFFTVAHLLPDDRIEMPAAAAPAPAAADDR